MVSWPDESAASEGALWRFSLAFYALPGIAAACLDLQDREGRDVNMVLYALWVGLSRRGRLSPADLDRAEAAVADWRRDVVAPLRELRRRVKADPAAAALYDALKAAELAAEQVAQNRLERLAPSPPDGGGAAKRRADADANLTLYLGHPAPSVIEGALRDGPQS